MTIRPRIIFDTTVINRFADEREAAEPLIAGLNSGYAVRVTATNVEESVATPDSEKRHQLLEVCRQLIKGEGGEIIRPFHWIIEELIEQFERTGRADWQNTRLRLPDYEREVVLREIINDEWSAREREPRLTLRRSLRESSLMLNLTLRKSSRPVRSLVLPLSRNWWLGSKFRAAHSGVLERGFMSE